MIFHPNFGIVAILASFSVVHLGGWVAADNFACDVSLEFSTWEDKSIPKEYLPVPDIKLLKYGITHVLMERFDMNAGVGNWMTSQKFKSFQLKDGDPEDDDDDGDLENLHEDFDLEKDESEEAVEDVEDASDNSHRDLRRKKKKTKKKKKKKKVMIEPIDDKGDHNKPTSPPIDKDDPNKPTEPPVDTYTNFKGECWDWHSVPRWCLQNPDCFAEFVVACEEGDDDDYAELFDHRDLQLESPGSMPKECWRVKQCRKDFMKRKSMRTNWSTIAWIGFCNLCDDDDDHGESDVHRRARKREIARKERERRKKKRGPKIRLSLDQLVGGTFEDVGGSIETHLAFEDDVCDELAGLQREYSPLRTIQDCNIEFHCRPSFGEELDEEGDEDLVIVDNRASEVETNEGNWFLSYVTSWSMQQGQTESDSSPILYSITAGDAVAAES